LMIPLKFEDKCTQHSGAFVNRFAIGVVVGATVLRLPL
jgi:hypothetical protein